ncbi:NYN domain-containing protein OS=Streptomyces cyaneofuscatus OX=66883 GN=G3I52_18105 PE=4 SV=1 [Streptomyces cyaneofuscatus]
MPRVTVRLGALTRSDGRWAQKGVDAAMHAELTELARNRACSDVVLVTGDGDLLPGMMAAKEHGVAVHLWAVQAADGDYNQSEDLVAEADERRVLDRTWITKAVRAKDTRRRVRAAARAPARDRRDPLRAAARVRALRGARADPPRSPSTPRRAPRGRTAGEERVPRRQRASRRPRTSPPCAPPGPQPAQQPADATLRWSSDKGWVDRPAPPSRPRPRRMPTLAQLTTAEQRWADREEDITTVGGDPFEVGQVFARRWVERLGDQGHLQKLSGMYPRIPHRVDGELLRYAARFGLLAHKDDQIDERDRYAIRAGFWREIDVRARHAEHAPAGE